MSLFPQLDASDELGNTFHKNTYTNDHDIKFIKNNRLKTE